MAQRHSAEVNLENFAHDGGLGWIGEGVRDFPLRVSALDTTPFPKAASTLLRQIAITATVRAR
jgi:hypothetical protein